MPRRALRCVVDLDLHAVSAPGVWLPSREDVYLSVSLFGQYRNTRLLTSVFPLLVHEHFRFEKTYYSALDPSEVADYLEDELVVFEVVQLSEYTDGAVRLASFSTNARDFLYPFPSLAPTYSSTDRELLLSRSVAFPGISPKLEFATKTVIKESLSPEIDALEDALEDERERRSFRKTRRSPTRRPRSPSLSRRVADVDLSDDKPPFVVRKLSKELTGRVPGGGPKSKGKKTKRSLSASRDDMDVGRSSLKHQYHLEKVIREPLQDPLPVFKSKYGASDSEDAEVADLTSQEVTTYNPPRPRSASPVLYRPSFSARYGTRPYSPTYYSLMADRVRRRLEEERLARLADVTYPYWPYYSSLDRYRYLSPYYGTSLVDLELSTDLARSRSPQSLVHVDNGQYWTERAAQLGGKSHRELFNSNLSKSYNRLSRNARSMGSTQ